jgi:hypothetical protein
MADTDLHSDRGPERGPSCTAAHRAAKRSAEAFEAFVDRARDWRDLALRIGECPRCATTLCRPLTTDGGQR